MVYQQRLPSVNSDDGTWGNILNQFLSLQHYNTGVDNIGLGNFANGSHIGITIQPGTTTLAPLTFSAPTALLTTPVAGSVEFSTDRLYYTSTTGPTRLTIAAYNDTSGAPGDIHYRDSGGNFVRLAIGATPGQVLTTSAGLLPVWSAPGPGLTQPQTMAINSMRI
jgi:hypothetical protein